MALLSELASVFRSKNAGPFLVTVDLMFGTESTFEQVANSGVLNPETVARLYQISAAEVRVVPYARAKAIKVTLPRLWGRAGAGSPGDRDVYGAQQHGPLMDLEIPMMPQSQSRGAHAE